MPTTRSKSRFHSSTLDRHADSREDALRGFLTGLCRAPALHARFLNTLSLLEYIGSRKIMLSGMKSPLSTDRLRHLAEETRHASYFRRAAEKIGGRALVPFSAVSYIGRLDAVITRTLGPDRERFAYLYVTAVIELRAVRVYRLYEEVLRAENIDLTLRGILAEEDGHLRDIGETLRIEDPLWESRLDGFARQECGLFDSWFNNIRGAEKR